MPLDTYRRRKFHFTWRADWKSSSVAIFDKSRRQRFFSRRAGRTSSSLELDSIPFLLKDRIENPDLFCQLTRIQHRFFPEEWIANFNLSYANRHDYDYDYDYAAASLSPTFLFLTCRPDSISFLPEERIENPGSSSSRHVYSMSFLFPEKKVNWKFSSSFATRYVDRVFIFPKSGLKIQLYQPFCPYRYCGPIFSQSGLIACY